MPSEVGVEVACPWYQITQITQPAGIRLPKLKREYATGASAGAGYGFGRNPLPSIYYPASNPERFQHDTGWRDRRFAQPKLGNLPMTAYAYFSGQQDEKATLAVCRFCGTNTWGDKDRQTHIANSTIGPRFVPHTKLLDQIAQRLLTHGYCVGCGEKTNGRRWGFPLCQKQFCLDGWMFHREWAYKSSWWQTRSSVLDEALK